MRKTIKKRYLILFIIALLISAISIFLLANREQKIEIAKNETNTIDSNSIISIDETSDANNEIVENIIDSNTTNEQTIELESITQEKALDKAHEITSDNYTEEKETTSNNNVEEKTQKQIVSNTKEENKPITNPDVIKQENIQEEIVPEETVKQEPAEQEQAPTPSPEQEIIQPGNDEVENLETNKIDLSKYDYYENSLNGGYKAFVKDDAEIAKLKSLINTCIEQFGYTNAKVEENADSSLATSGLRYFTANITNVQNAVYDSDYFTISYYAEKEYHISADGKETFFQIRSYIKVK